MTTPFDDLIRTTLSELAAEAVPVNLTQRAFDQVRRRRAITIVLTAATATAVLIGTPLAFAATYHGSRPAAPAQALEPSQSVPSPVTAGRISCTVERLPMQAGQPPKSVVTGGDPTGRYLLGRSYPGNGQSYPLLIWDNGQVHMVAMTGQDQQLADINSAGVAVGTSYVGRNADETAAWVYQNGAITRLAGGAAQANGINDQGVIVGSVGGKPATWRSTGSPPTMLNMPGTGWTGAVNAIDEDGTMVGTVQAGPTQTRIGYLWRPDGTAEQLPVPVGNGKQVTEYTATAIRGGWVGGWAGQDVGRFVNLNTYFPRWNLRTGALDLPTFGQIEAINGRGWFVVGSVGHGGTLVADGKPVTLPDLGDTNQPALTIPHTINDDGTIIAGQTDSANGDPVAVVWQCR